MFFKLILIIFAFILYFFIVKSNMKKLFFLTFFFLLFLETKHSIKDFINDIYMNSFCYHAWIDWLGLFFKHYSGQPTAK